MSWEPAGRDRVAWGCIATFENEARQTLSLHRTGVDALRQCCDVAESLDPTFRVVSISTPVSIYSDLNGRMPNERTGAIDLPEHRKLGQIKRLRLIHPRLQPRSSQALRRAWDRGDVW